MYSELLSPCQRTELGFRLLALTWTCPGYDKTLMDELGDGSLFLSLVLSFNFTLFLTLIFQVSHCHFACQVSHA